MKSSFLRNQFLLQTLNFIWIFGLFSHSNEVYAQNNLQSEPTEPMVPSAKGGGSTGVGGGGDAFVKPTGEVLFFDLAERRPFSPSNLGLRIQLKSRDDTSLAAKTVSIDDFFTNDSFFFPALGRQIVEKFTSGEIGWFFTEGELIDVKDEEFKNTMLDTSLFVKGIGDPSNTKSKIQQAAVYFEKNVIVNRLLFEKMDDNSKIYLLVHEALRAIFEDGKPSPQISSAGLRRFTSMIFEPSQYLYNINKFLPRFADAFLDTLKIDSNIFDSSPIGSTGFSRAWNLKKITQFLLASRLKIFEEFQSFLGDAEGVSDLSRSINHQVLYARFLGTMNSSTLSTKLIEQLTNTTLENFNASLQKLEKGESAEILSLEKTTMEKYGDLKYTTHFQVLPILNSREFLANQSRLNEKSIFGIYSWGQYKKNFELIQIVFNLSEGTLSLHRAPLSFSKVGHPTNIKINSKADAIARSTGVTDFGSFLLPEFNSYNTPIPPNYQIYDTQIGLDLLSGMISPIVEIEIENRSPDLTVEENEAAQNIATLHPEGIFELGNLKINLVFWKKHRKDQHFFNTFNQLGNDLLPQLQDALKESKPFFSHSQIQVVYVRPDPALNVGGSDIFGDNQFYLIRELKKEELNLFFQKMEK